MKSLAQDDALVLFVDGAFGLTVFDVCGLRASCQVSYGDGLGRVSSEPFYRSSVPAKHFG